MIVNSISCTQPANNIQKQNRIQNKNNNKFISFKAGLTTLKEKSDIFIPKISDYIKNAKIITLDGLNTILHMVTNTANIEEFTDNVKKIFCFPKAPNAFVTTHMQYNITTNKMNPNINRTIYLKLPLQNQTSELLKTFKPESYIYNQYELKLLLNSIVHETTHVFQDNSSDRLSLVEFYTKFFEKNNPTSVRIDTYSSSTNIFRQVEYSLLETLDKVRPYINNNPKKTPIENIEDAYNNHLNTSLVPDIKSAIDNALVKCKLQYPECDLVQLMNTIHYMIQCEIEAYSTGINAANKTFPSVIELKDYYPEILKFILFMMEEGTLSLSNKFMH